MDILQDQRLYFLLIAIVAYIAYSYFKKKKGLKGGVNIFKNKNSNHAPTPFLDMYTVDFTSLFKEGSIDPVIGRDEEVRQLTQVLSRRRKNNAMLIGEPGVGKTAVVEGLAQRIAKNEAPQILLNKRILALEVSSLMSGTKYRGEFEERAKKIIKEIADAGRSIILFIDEVHVIVQSHGTEGAINFADILKPALARGELQMIGATTYKEYEKYIKTDLSLERRFQPIQLKPPTKKDSLEILKGLKEKYQEYHKVEFTDAALETAVDLSDKLIKDRNLPDKAIDAIDEAAAMVKVSNINESIPAILFEAAKIKNPKLVVIWKKIQEVDQQSTSKNEKTLVQKREELEDQLGKQGITVVDSDDIEKVVKEWID